MGGVVVLSEGKGVPAIEPPQVGVEAVVGSADAHSGSGFVFHEREVSALAEIG